eukprot:TRINITY_DN32077_c0_g1_i2.p1 TRINITY_DN32077_c0_g1~~TRINITY_DN32077_c0_g1_i2.p1  ORF type:complete len:278 (+),score=35.95 TRINITY_DN32077_c0_g1_i2:96-929(+)
MLRSLVGSEMCIRDRYMPTLPKRLWTMNRAAEELSVNDTFRYHPWRAPGSAPVEDGCGMAGGTTPAHAGPGHATFMDVSDKSSAAWQGALGSHVLAPTQGAGQPWQIGGVATVKWGLRFNHGGGYQYRLCPGDEVLTEDCFQRFPLRFVEGSQRLEWRNGTVVNVSQPEYVNEGVIPVGFDWAMNPIPVITLEGCNGTNCIEFAPPCHDSGWERVPGSSEPDDVAGTCSGNWIDGMIVDEVVVPTNVAVGKYVLGWRWDAEQTSQVWSGCADIELVA